MISAIAILVILLALFFCIWYAMNSSLRRSSGRPSFNRKQNEIDLEVLTLLLSREEDDYLRASLPDREFRQTKKQRVKLAWKYLHEVSKNTRHLIRIVESARSSSDPELARAAHELLEKAFRVRMNVPVVQLSLLIEWFWPTLRLRAPLKIDRYREMIKTAIFILQQLEAAHSGPLSQLGNAN